MTGTARSVRRPRTTEPASRRSPARPRVDLPSASERFRGLDLYRVEREWRRYEGTAQRRLWRELRERFLERHARGVGWTLDLGSGPGRFTPWAGGPHRRPVALDLSTEMLRELPPYWTARRIRGPVPDRVRGDAGRPPFPSGRFEEVVALGNALGFAEGSSERLLEETMGLVAPNGTLLLEIAPGPGERSRYLARLPVSSVGRLFRAPVAVLLARIRAGGFAPEPPRRSEPGAFRRVAREEVIGRLESAGWKVVEVRAVAPVLGPDPRRIHACAADPKAWGHLLEVEEAVGQDRERSARAAAVLLAAVRHPSMHSIK